MAVFQHATLEFVQVGDKVERVVKVVTTLTDGKEERVFEAVYPVIQFPFLIGRMLTTYRGMVS